MAELNLSISIMPAKHVVTLSVLMTDTIAEMKSKLSKRIDFPAESMKIVNGGRPCADSSTIEEIGLNYCSRVICAAKGFAPVGEQTSKEKEPDSKLMIKLDGSRSVDVPYGINTTWRQLKVCLQKVAHIDSIDYIILMNDNAVNDNDLVSSAHVNYMSVIHAVRRDFHALLDQPLQRSQIHLHCSHCKADNPAFVIRPLCSECSNGYIMTNQPIHVGQSTYRELFHMNGTCGNRDCRKYNIQSPVCFAFVCKNCPLDAPQGRSVMCVIRPTEQMEEQAIKQQLNKLFGY